MICSGDGGCQRGVKSSLFADVSYVLSSSLPSLHFLLYLWWYAELCGATVVDGTAIVDVTAAGKEVCLSNRQRRSIRSRCNWLDRKWCTARLERKAPNNEDATNMLLGNIAVYTSIQGILDETEFAHHFGAELLQKRTAHDRHVMSCPSAYRTKL